jgi:shikimate dehydrogenase
VGVSYETVRVPAARLRALFPQLRRQYLGLNVTRPLKEMVVDLCDVESTEAAQAGSVNTITFKDGLAHGASTDVAAFIPAIRTVTSRNLDHAVILGTGGAARAAAFALSREESRVHVAGRNQRAGIKLASDLDVSFDAITSPRTFSALQRADLLVNATPVGGGALAGRSALPDGAPLPSGGLVFDLVYRPPLTPLLQRARSEGCETVEGLQLLIEQAVLSFQIWTGREGPREVMRAAAVEAMREREPASTSVQGGRI